MNKYMGRGMAFAIAIWLAAVTCNLPAGLPALPTGTAIPVQEVAVNAETPTDTALPAISLTETPSAVPAAASCYPMVTAGVDANIRNGPGTAYDIVGFLPAGGTARVTGRNDANTWWYIEFAGGSGGYAWIAGSVTNSSCLPAVVQVVAAPPPPPVVEEETQEEEEPDEPEPAGAPDLYISGYQWAPEPAHMGQPIDVQVTVYNQGNARADAYTVEWWLSVNAPAPACTWNVNFSNAGGGRVLECSYTPAGCANYPSQVVVDAGGSNDESNEGNNTWNETLLVRCD